VDRADLRWTDLPDARAFYLDRVRRFRRRLREAVRSGDGFACDLAVRCTVSAVAACWELSAGPEAERLASDADDVWD